MLPKPSSPFAGKKIVIFTLVAAGLLLGAGWRLFINSLEHANTISRLNEQSKTVTGKVVSKHGTLGTFAMNYTVDYTYWPNTGEPDQTAAPISGSSSVSRELFKNTQPENWIAVYYDPTEPSASMIDLQHNRKLSLYLPGLIAGPVFLLAGLAILLVLLFMNLPPTLKMRLLPKKPNSSPTALGKKDQD